MNRTRIYDRVHGEVCLPPFLGVLLSRTEVTRLEHIRQLGCTIQVFPSASHTRLEHSIGVSHLAGKAGSMLAERYGSNVVDNTDILCLYVAGLLHDVGHGPFSHLFEDFVMESTGAIWSHEDMSLKIIDRLFSCPTVVASFKGALQCSNAKVQEHINFVKLLVHGLPAKSPWPSDVGRTREKAFLLDILHATNTGIDVDKLDYLQRDNLVVFGSGTSLSISRILASLRISMPDDGISGILPYSLSRIVFDERMEYEIKNVYAERCRMHLRVYQHRAVLVADQLIKEMMMAVDAKQGNRFALAAFDIDQFIQLSDHDIFAAARRECEGLWDFFTSRPWFHRLPLVIKLATLPLCQHCKMQTEVLAKFCPNCGSSTIDRPHMVDADDVCVPPKSDIGRHEILEELLRCQADEKKEEDKCLVPPSGGQVQKLIIHVATITTGVKKAEADPHGKQWYSYKNSIPLCTDENKVFESSCDNHALLRMVYFYLPLDCVTKEEEDRLKKIIAKWSDANGHCITLCDGFEEA